MFGNYAKVSEGLRNNTRTIDLEFQDHTVTLTVKSATKYNKEYLNGLVAIMARHQKSGKKGKRKLETDEEIAAAAEELMQKNGDILNLFAKHVLVDWDGVKSDKGTKATFNETNARKFLEAIPDHMWDGISEYCGDPSNFMDAPTAEDVEAQAKN